MSYGTVKTFKTKTELKRAVEQLGADRVEIFGTAINGSEKAVTVAELAGTSAVIVGPDVHSDRRWYANVINTRNGIKIK